MFKLINLSVCAYNFLLFLPEFNTQICSFNQFYKNWVSIVEINQMLGNLLVVLFISTVQYIKNCYSCHDITIKSFQNSFPVKLVIILIFIFNHHFSQRLWRIVTLKFKELMRYFQVISAITILKHFMPEYNHFFDQRLSSNNH